jgi:hypothetical protein
MSEDNLKFETFLRGFEPRRPEPLPPAATAWHESRWLAAAAVALAVLGGLTWAELGGIRRRGAERLSGVDLNSRSTTRTVPALSSVALTRMALEDGKQFDIQMNEMAQSTLPRCDRTSSGLRLLAEE